MSGTSQRHEGNFFLFEILLKAGLLVIACSLSYKTRNVGQKFADGMTVMAAVYNIVVIGGIALLISQSQDIVPMSVILQSVGAVLTVVVVMLILFVPKLGKTKLKLNDVLSEASNNQHTIKSAYESADNSLQKQIEELEKLVEELRANQRPTHSSGAPTPLHMLPKLRA